MQDESTLDRRATEASRAFATALRARRQEMGMTQDDLALATGVGRRFIIELESGKPTAQLGRSLLVAQRLGFGIVSTVPASRSDEPELPELEEENEHDGPSNLF